MTEEEVRNLTHDKMFNELCKMKGVKKIRDLHTAIDIVIDNLAGKVDSDVNIYDNPVFAELVAFMILKGTKDKDSGIAGDHIVEGALLLAVAQALKCRHDENRTPRKTNTHTQQKEQQHEKH